MESADTDSLQQRLARAETEVRLHAWVSEQFARYHGSQGSRLQAVVDQVGTALGFDQVFVYEAQPGTEQLRLTAWRGLTDEQRRAFSSLPFGAMMCGMVAQSRQRLVEDSMATSPYPEARELAVEGICSYAGFPLMARDTLLGTAAFARRRPEPFDEIELETLQGICNLTAIELLRARDARRLLDREAQVRSAMDAALAIAFDWDIVANRVRRLQSEEEMLPRTDGHDDTLEGVAQVVHPEDRELFFANVRRALESSTGIYRSEYRLMRKDGTVRWLNEHGRVEFDETGQPLRLVGISYDVTTRRRDEAALEERHRFISEVTALVPGVIYVFDVVERRNIFVSRQSGALLGYSDAEVLAMGDHFLREVLHPDDVPVIERHMQRRVALNDGEVQEAEYRFRHRDGRWRWFLSQDVVYQRAADGSVRQVLGIATDITDRRQLEAGSRAVEERFRRASAAAKALVYEVDLTGESPNIVHGMLHVIGEELPSTSEAWHGRIHPEDLPAHRAALAELRVTPGNRWDSTYRVRHADGSWREVEDTAEVVTDETGRTKLVGTIIDVTARRSVLRELHTHAERLRLATESAGIGTFDIDVATGTLHRSARSAELVGRPGLTHTSLVEAMQDLHEDELTRVKAAVAGALDPAGDGFARLEVRSRPIAGATRWQEYTMQTLFEETGAGRVARRVVGVHADTTARREYESDLRTRAAHQTFRVRLMDELREADGAEAAAITACRLLGGFLGVDRVLSCELDAEGRVAMVRSQWHGDGLASLAGTYHVGTALDALPRLRAGELLVAGDVVRDSDLPEAVRAALQRVGFGACVVAPVVDDGRPVHLLVVATTAPRAWRGPELDLIHDTGDRTWSAMETARAEAALREAEERFRLLADHAPVLIWSDPIDGGNFVNRAYLTFVGLDDLPATGVDWARFLHPDDRGWYVKEYLAAVQGRRRFQARFRFRRFDGEYRWMHCVGMPHQDGQGNFLGYVGTTVDVTESVRAEESSREAARQKDEFIAVLAHELRNPLAPIRTSVGILRLQRDLDPIVARCRDIIDRQVAHMARLLDDLLDVSRLSRGKLTLQRQLVRLADVLDVAIETARPLIDERGHTLHVAPFDRAIVLDADSARLAQVFANLLNNAAKYTNPSGRLDIEVEPAEGEVRVRVRDNGVGIDPAIAGRIFDLFAQGVDSREKGDGGLGIGLGLSRQLAELHGGSIRAESAGRGQGTTFTVVLPLGEARPAEPGGAAANGAAIGKAVMERHRVLVVDDNADAADTIAILLDGWGCEVRTVYDGESALREAEAFQPVLVLLDLGMPGMSGQVVCNRLRGTPWGEGMVIAALTGWGQEEDRRRTKALGFDHHLVKPADPELLRRLVTSVGAGRV